MHWIAAAVGLGLNVWAMVNPAPGGSDMGKIGLGLALMVLARMIQAEQKND
jgi:hypothetical protein